MSGPVSSQRVGRRRRVGAVLAAGSLLGMVLTACGQTDPEDEGLKADCPAIAEKPAKGNGTIVYWSMWTEGEPQQKVLQRTFDCFTKQTGIKVEPQWFGRTSLTQNVAPALNTDDVPDLIDQDISQINAAVAAPGGLQDVSDVMSLKVSEGDSTVADVIDESYYDFAENKLKDGGQMVVPYEVLSNAWWYDKGSVSDFTAPATTDDLFALFDAAKKDGKAAISQDGDIDFYNAYFFTQWAEQYVGPGGLLKAAKDKSGKSWTDDDGFLKAAQLVERLAEGDYFIDGWDANKFPTIQQQWAEGKSSYIFVGSWVTSEAGEYLKKRSGGGEVDFDFASFPFPQAEGATHKTVEQMPIGFAVTKKAANAEATKALIAYALNKENITPISSVAQNLVPREDVEAPAGLAEVKASLEDPEAEKAVFMDAMDGQAPDWTKEVFYPLNNKLLKGEISGQQFVDQLASKTQSFYN